MSNLPLVIFPEEAVQCSGIHIRFEMKRTEFKTGSFCIPSGISLTFWGSVFSSVKWGLY